MKTLKDIFSLDGFGTEDLLKEPRSAILFGAGAAGKNAIKILMDHDFEIRFICDNDKKKHGTKIRGLPIHPPEQLTANKDAVVLITSDYCVEISNQLNALGIAKYYYFGFCFDFDRWKNHFDPNIILNSRTNIEEAYEVLYDERSRNIFSDVIEFRYTMKPPHKMLAMYPEYFHPKVQPEQDDCIVDGGAWLGDTSICFNKYLEGNCRIYAFEPEDSNFEKLRKNIQENAIGGRQNIVPVHAGLWSETKTLKMNSAVPNNMQFQIDDCGNVTINVTTVDEFSHNSNVTFDLIKMDIEGSELQALKGCERTIQHANPRLQICSYHEVDDFWHVPITIRTMYTESNIYLDHHSQTIFESIVYATS